MLRYEQVVQDASLAVALLVVKGSSDVGAYRWCCTGGAARCPLARRCPLFCTLGPAAPDRLGGGGYCCTHLCHAAISTRRAHARGQTSLPCRQVCRCVLCTARLWCGGPRPWRRLATSCRLLGWARAGRVMLQVMSVDRQTASESSQAGASGAAQRLLSDQPWGRCCRKAAAPAEGSGVCTGGACTSNPGCMRTLPTAHCPLDCCLLPTGLGRLCGGRGQCR